METNVLQAPLRVNLLSVQYESPTKGEMLYALNVLRRGFEFPAQNSTEQYRYENFVTTLFRVDGRQINIESFVLMEGR